jgi:hypothetical protein
LFPASLGTVFWSLRSHPPPAQLPAVFGRGTALVPVDASSRLHTAVNADPQLPAATPPVGVTVGVRIGVGVTVPVGVPVTVALGEPVGVTVAVGEAVAVALGVSVGVAAAVGVAVAVAVGVALAVGISVAVAVVVPVAVVEGVAVDEGDGVGVTVGGGVSVAVGDAVGLGLDGDAVGVTPGESDRARKKCGWFRVMRVPYVASQQSPRLFRSWIVSGRARIGRTASGSPSFDP